MAKKMKIGIFGISGVGKSFLVNQFISSNANNFIATRASKLIAQVSNNILFNELTFSSVENNQSVLTEQFKFFCAENSDKHIIIELHNYIETPDGIVEIDDSILYALNLDAVCFLYLQPEIIFKQRSADKLRARAKISIDHINELQEQSLLKFNITFGKCEIPHIVLKNNHINNFSLFVTSLLGDAPQK